MWFPRGFAVPFLFLASFTFLQADTFVVLPFFNETKSANLDWIGESVAETVREAAVTESILAIDRVDREEAYRRLSIRPYAVLTKASILKIGQTLGADKVLYGWVELIPPAQAPAAGAAKAVGTLKLTARFVDLKHLNEGREFSETGALDDLAALQRHLAWQALQLLTPSTAPSETDFGARLPAIRVDALENYIRGILSSSRQEKVKLFGQAARLDPGFSQAHFELGRLAWQGRDYKTAVDWFMKVSASDYHYSEANFFLGLSLYELGDFAGAEKALRIVARDFPMSEVLNDLGATQSRRNMPEALDNFEKASSLDESEPAYQFNIGYELWKKGDFTGAEARFKAVLERDPDDVGAPMLIERCRRASGPKPDDASTEKLERIKTNFEASAYLQLKDVFRSKQP
jgi:tetratricopeptide (TPR) repeat protein